MPSLLNLMIAPRPQERQAYAGNGIKHPEPIFLCIVMYDHVAANLSRVESVVPYLQQADHLEREDMEHKDR